MSTTELKERLIDKIQSTKDERILLEALRLLEIQLHEIEKPFPLTEEMKVAVDEAEAQIDAGNIQSHEEANKEIAEWLEK